MGPLMPYENHDPGFDIGVARLKTTRNRNVRLLNAAPIEPITPAVWPFSEPPAPITVYETVIVELDRIECAVWQNERWAA